MASADNRLHPEAGRLLSPIAGGGKVQEHRAWVGERLWQGAALRRRIPGQQAAMRLMEGWQPGMGINDVQGPLNTY
jgi:hypothetical protein